MINQLQYTPVNSRNPDTVSNSVTPATILSSTYHKTSEFDNHSSFGLASQADGTLLTPDSATQSPESQGVAKFPTTYPTPPSCSAPLLHETSGHTRMYGQWSSSFDLNAPSSQASSPMTTQPSVGGEFLPTYDHDHGGRRTPGPPEQHYMGHFGVSDPHSMSQAGPPYYVGLPALDHHGGHPSMMRDEPSSIPNGRSIGRGGVTESLLSQPSHPYGDARRNSLTDPNHANRPINGSPRSGSVTRGGRVRKTARGKRRESGTGKGGSHDADLVGEHMNCLGQEVPPTLKPTCPDEERCIFESRWRHRKDKGQDMWDGIQKDYQQHFNRPPPVKETLQMKFKRARSKYIEWLPEDVDKLRAAWKELEDERYEMLLHRFLKKGGSRNMLLNATDIEFKVVQDLKLEEGLYMPSFQQGGEMNIRRRHKANPPKKRSSGRSTATPQQNTVVKMEADGDTNMGSHDEDEILNQVQDARRDYDRFSDGGNSGNSGNVHQHSLGRWGPGVSMVPTTMWDNRPSVNMSPMPEHLLGHSGGQGVHRR
ncbi:hypothetical protein CC79DRAFT_1364041 [Sarocladium strictum]